MQIEFGTDEQYLGSWLQFDVAYRANVAAVCHTQVIRASGADGPAAALECFQQYLFVIEDLAMWAAAISAWQGGKSLVDAVEAANAKWPLFEQLGEADGSLLVEVFGLPPPSDFNDEVRPQYEEWLAQWSIAAQDVGKFAAREAQNGGQLAKRLQNKMKHGLHFAVANDGGTMRVHFYPHHASQGEKLELPTVGLSAESAERWVRRAYDTSRFLAAILKTLFVARFVHDPVAAWIPRTEPNNQLKLDEIKEDLARVKVPVLEWVGDD